MSILHSAVRARTFFRPKEALKRKYRSGIELINQSPATTSDAIIILQLLARKLPRACEVGFIPFNLKHRQLINHCYNLDSRE